ncbi:MAG: TIGR00266 family protein [Chloroflexi bacterium]|nr:TIGR00266 family protein [Chloroflexota bacterium]MYC47180.1 TIGR00266 family protein [Chloroflexota bacterium]
MQTHIEFDPAYALLTVNLDPGESIKAEPGAMVAQRGVSMQTGSAGGGLVSGFKRMLGGESFFINTFTAESGGGQVSLAPATPGDIGTFDLEPDQNLFIQASSFMACTANVQTDSQFQGFRGFFSGESVFFLRAFSEGDAGTVYYNSYGAIKKLAVEPGSELVVDTGHLVAFSDDVDYTIGKVGGLRSLLVGGEGLVMRFTGEGQVWVQTRNLSSLAARLVPFLPTSKRGQ